MSQSVYLLVYQRVLFYILILPGDVRLGLIIIVVGDKILHRILGKEFPELTAKLCGKGLVMRKHECRAIQPRYHIRHGERLARTGDAEQRLRAVAVLYPANELVYRLRLIARRLKFGMQYKFIRHILTLSIRCRRQIMRHSPPPCGPERSHCADKNVIALTSPF